MCSPLSSNSQHLYNKHSFSTTNHHLGPPIKWWEGIGNETQMNNDMLNLTHEIVKISSKLYVKTFVHAFYRFRHMAEASSTKNMDVCMVAENEITNIAQKKTPSVLVTITQKKTKSKKSLGVRGLFL